MQWDHRPGVVKLGTISGDFRGRHRQAVLDEIAKCDLVCANCHMVRTNSRCVQAPVDPPQQRKRGRRAADVDVVASPGDVIHRCARCHEWKPVAAFPRSRSGQLSYCTNCRRKYDQRYYAERGGTARRERQRSRRSREREWMRALKERASCADCKGAFPGYVMQWDHLPGQEKIADISRMAGRTRAVVLAEVAKCELVCANCHAVRTARRATKRDGSSPKGRRPTEPRPRQRAVGVAGLEPAKPQRPKRRALPTELHPGSFLIVAPDLVQAGLASHSALCSPSLIRSTFAPLRRRATRLSAPRAGSIHRAVNVV